jgi:hypothetical protein
MTTEWAMASYTKVDCYKCGLLFYVPAGFDANRRNDHKTFWCPNGHNQAYTGKTNAQKYKELYEKEQACCAVKSQKLRAVNDEALSLTRSVNGYKGKVTQLMNRITNSETKEAAPS